GRLEGARRRWVGHGLPGALGCSPARARGHRRRGRDLPGLSSCSGVRPRREASSTRAVWVTAIDTPVRSRAEEICSEHPGLPETRTCAPVAATSCPLRSPSSAAVCGSNRLYTPAEPQQISLFGGSESSSWGIAPSNRRGALVICWPWDR